MLFGKLFRENEQTTTADKPSPEQSPKEVKYERKYIEPLLRGTAWNGRYTNPPRVPMEILDPCINDLIEVLKKYDLKYDQIDTIFYALADEISTRKEIAEVHISLSIGDILPSN